MKKVFSALFLTSFLAVLLVPAMMASAKHAGWPDCPNSCVTLAANCNCGDNAVSADDPKYCLDGTRYNRDTEGQNACVAAIGGGTTEEGGYREIPTNVPSTPAELVALIGTIGNWIFTILLGIAVIMLILAGFFWITAGGDPEKVKKASEMLRNALIGVAIALAAKGLVAVIENLILK